METIFFIVILGIAIGILVWGGFLLFSAFRKKAQPSLVVRILEYSCLIFLCFSFLIFALLQTYNNKEYYETIDPIDNGYTPFASAHILTLIVFLFFSVLSMVLIWLKGRSLPPLLVVLAIVFLIIGIGISFAVILQVSENLDGNKGPFYFFAPISYIVISLLLIIKLVMQEMDYSVNRKLNNQFLNKLNNLMIKGATQPLWIIILLIPIFCIVMIFLVLLGQEPDSITKVFTETTTWHFSQMEHPPYLDHNGHYLCTVAACGHQAIVKPLRFGMRHNNQIIVNRQLLVANAFEERIMELSPRIHRFIRDNYDRYGYPLSKQITTPILSDIVYILMKPFEYFFVITLYLLDTNPEKRIANQYKLKE